MCVNVFLLKCILQYNSIFSSQLPHAYGKIIHANKNKFDEEGIMNFIEIYAVRNKRNSTSICAFS